MSEVLLVTPTGTAYVGQHLAATVIIHECSAFTNSFLREAHLHLQRQEIFNQMGTVLRCNWSKPK